MPCEVKAKFSVGEMVYRYKSHPRPEFESGAYEVTKVVMDRDGVRYTISKDGTDVFDFPEFLLKSVGDFNTRDVPYHVYELKMADGTSKIVDVGDEDDWGNLQDCTPGDCTDWMFAIGYGNDNDGHVRIVRVLDTEDNSVWSGNSAVRSWYQSCVACFTENYSD